METIEFLKLLSEQSGGSNLIEQVKINSENIETLNFKVDYTFWILFAMLFAWMVASSIVFWYLSRRLKKIN